MSSRCQAKGLPKGLMILVQVVGVMVMHPMVQAVTKSPYKQTQVIYYRHFREHTYQHGTEKNPPILQKKNHLNQSFMKIVFQQLIFRGGSSLKLTLHLK